MGPHKFSRHSTEGMDFIVEYAGAHLNVINSIHKVHSQYLSKTFSFFDS